MLGRWFIPRGCFFLLLTLLFFLDIKYIIVLKRRKTFAAFLPLDLKYVSILKRKSLFAKKVFLRFKMRKHFEAQEDFSKKVFLLYI